MFQAARDGLSNLIDSRMKNGRIAKDVESFARSQGINVLIWVP